MSDSFELKIVTDKQEDILDAVKTILRNQIKPASFFDNGQELTIFWCEASNASVDGANDFLFSPDAQMLTQLIVGWRDAKKRQPKAKVENIDGDVRIGFLIQSGTTGLESRTVLKVSLEWIYYGK